jgi:hypothetical protein
MVLTQSEIYEQSRQEYGGSDPTLPSFLRPYYVKYNSVTKSRDLGTTDILVADLRGEVGAEAGANTLFFRVELPRRVELSVNKITTGAYTDRYISVGILDRDRKPVPLDEYGYATENDIHATSINESLLGVPAGVYYITVTSNQWQRIPYAISVAVGRYALLEGVARGTSPLSGRIPLVKPSGASEGSALSIATLLNPNVIKEASGQAGGTSTPTLTLSIMRGVAIGSMVPTGRLMMNWKLSGTADGSDLSEGTLSSQAQGGGGYGY